MDTIYQKGADSVYDLNGKTYYANGANAGQVHPTSDPAAPPTVANPAPGASYTPPSSPPVTFAADSASNPVQPLVPPTSTPATPPDYYAKVLASVPTNETILGEKSAEQIAAEGTKNSWKDTMMQAIQKMGLKTQAQATAEQNAGLPDLQKNLTEVTSQILALQNEAKAIPLEIQNESAGRDRTQGGIAPLEAGRMRVNAIKALGLSSIAATLQGNVALAQATADRAVAAEFGPLQAQIDYLKEFYTINQDELQRADAKQAAVIQAKLADRQSTLDQAKADRATVINMANAAAKTGAPAATVSQAISMDLAGATKLLTPYLKDITNTDFTLSAGQTRYGPDGKAIASVPATVKTTKATDYFPHGVMQSGSIVMTQADIDQGAQALMASASTTPVSLYDQAKGIKTDGKYANPDLYLQMYKHWITSGGKETDFFKFYPFATYIDPANTWVAGAISDFNNADTAGGQAP